jgi:Raf kinase inhibitor-like YbhB/YbcL family protein
MRLLQIIALAALISVNAAVDAAAAQPGEAMRMAIDRPETAGGRFLIALKSPAIQANGTIPRKYVDISPPLSWTPIPGTASYVMIVEDADAGDRGLPFLHWVAWNIAPNVKALPEGAAARPNPGFVQGKSDAGSVGYFGPHPPPGRPHHYHLQLFAVEGVVNLPAGATREEVLRTINGHVLGKGELVASFASGG